MPRPIRDDQPGSWHHVTNRGVAQRPIFESRRDVRYFLSRLVYTVHRGAVELHALCVLPNHYHLLVRSLRGEVAPALQWAQSLYARHFNRSRERDGPVFTDRYRSSLVDSTAYLVNVFRYIEGNPVDARLVSQPGEYPYASAWYHAKGRIPRWLCTSALRDLLLTPTSEAELDWPRYRRFLSRGQADQRNRMAEDGLGGRENGGLSFDDLFRSSSVDVQCWLRSRALTADGPSASCGLAAVSPLTVLEALGSASEELRSELAPGLLLHSAGLSVAEIALHLGISRPTAYKRIAGHEARIRQEPRYAEEAERIFLRCLDRDHPGVRGMPALRDLG